MMITIPGMARTEELVLNDVVDVTIEAAEVAMKTDDWRLGYALMVHSSQNFTIHSPRKVWAIDDYLQWSNLAYLTVLRAEYLSELERVVCPFPTEDVQDGPRTEQQLCQAIARKFVAYKRWDRTKGLRSNLKVNDILRFKGDQTNHCAACNIELLQAYALKNTQQFSVDRLDNSLAHTRNSIRLTYLECNRTRGCAALHA